MGDVRDFTEAFDVEPAGEGRFRAKCLDGRGREVVDGSQLLAQAIVAACKSQPGKDARSAHGTPAHRDRDAPASTAMRPHRGIGEAMAHRSLSTGVLALTVSFHDPVRSDEWLLYAHESPDAGRGLSYGRAQVFTRDGRLVASFSQENMIRGLAAAAKGMGPGAGL